MKFFFFFSFILFNNVLFDMTEETDSNPDRYRESDRSSNLSDVKADIRAGSSVSNAESVTALDSEGEGSTRGVNALALAGPVPNPLGYRYSADYTEPSFPPKNNVSTLSNISFVNLFSLSCAFNVTILPTIIYLSKLTRIILINRTVATIMVTYRTLIIRETICHRVPKALVHHVNRSVEYPQAVF